VFSREPVPDFDLQYMLPALLTAFRSGPTSLRRAAPGRPAEPEGAVALEEALLERPAPPARTPAEFTLGRRRHPGAQRRGATTDVLSAGEFERCFERERCLADRGTRRFSLLVLRQQGSARTARRERATLTGLARQLCERLRLTDLVGQFDVGRLEVLLTDTDSKGAQVVNAWAKQAGERLGLDLEHAIYVYPSVAEADRSGGLPKPLRTVRAAPGPLDPCEKQREADPADAHPSASSVGCAVRDLWPLLGVSTPLWKRAADIALSGVALLLLLPLFALVALAIRLDSPGPVIFRQVRAGRGGRPFVFYKFRSMTADAEGQREALASRNEHDGPVFKIKDDPRKTRVGRLLRRASIDELPQLWNVLIGDLSLVGPRSATLDEVEQYERWQRRRLCVTGGITCTWQVSGRSQIPFQEWMRLDVRYVAGRSVWLDLWLLVLTVPAVVSGRGAY
jgi:lipopolysaccharide/colanic/teichoic acid biosynthesis glycosyltransferase